MSSSRHSGTAAGRQSVVDTSRVSGYDFRQAHSLSSDQLRELQEQCGNLCRALHRYVPETTGLAARFALDRLLFTTYDEYLDSLPEMPIIAVCQFGTQSPPILWQIDTGPLFAYMDAMLGGDGSVPPVERELTMLERSLAAQMVEEFILTWTDAWPALEAAGAGVVEVRQSRGRFGVASLQEAMVAAVIRTSVADASGVMRIGLPSGTLKVLIRQTSANLSTTTVNEAARLDALERLDRCGLKVSVRMGSARVSLRQLRDLSTGDVVPLEQGPHELLEVHCAGQPKFRGVSGISNGHIGVRLTERITE